MIAFRTFAAIGAGALISLLAGSALAAPFTAVLDEFWVVKDSSEDFRDTFGDGVPPPSGPDGANTYVLFGPGGIAGEAADRLSLTPSLGEPTLITTTFAEMSTNAVRRIGLDSASPAFLGSGNSFEIHGLFDMSSLPAATGQSFGVRASDRAPALGNEGNNTLYLFVGVSSITGDVSVFLRNLDFSTNSSIVLGVDSIQSLLAGADQIELILSKPANSNVVSASYVLFDYDLANPILDSGSVGAGIIYQGENYIRPQFASTDLILLPEPGTLALAALALAGIGWTRRRKG